MRVGGERLAQVAQRNCLIPGSVPAKAGGSIEKPVLAGGPTHGRGVGTK